MTDREVDQKILAVLTNTCIRWSDVDEAITLLEERMARQSAMDDAIAAGDGTLHGAIDHWQARALRAEEMLSLEPIGFLVPPYGEFQFNPDIVSMQLPPQSAEWKLPLYAGPMKEKKA